MALLATSDHVPFNCPAPIPLWRCRHCDQILVTTARAHHLAKRHVVRSIVVLWKQSRLDDEYTAVRA